MIAVTRDAYTTPLNRNRPSALGQEIYLRLGQFSLVPKIDQVSRLSQEREDFLARFGQGQSGFSATADSKGQTLDFFPKIYPTATTPGDSELHKQKFLRLKSEWLREVGHRSKIRDRISSKAYLSIIAMGTSILPYVMEELRTAPRWWFAALEAITETNPVATEHLGDIPAMAIDWLNWWSVNKSSWMILG